eukprot:5837373-Heterocapsa_arctica.AAC.1
MIGDKPATSCGYAAGSEGCAFALRCANSSVLITEIDPVCTQSTNTNDVLVEGGAVHDSEVDEQSYFLI